MTSNLTFKQAIESGELGYYYFMYELTKDHNCQECPFKMGYDPSGDVYCYSQCFDSYEQALRDYKHSR